VTGLNPLSLQKDRLFSELKEQNEIDASEVPDLVPILAVCAAARSAQTRIYNVARLRLKESDRVKTVEAMLLALGAEVGVEESSIIIKGKDKLRGGEVDGANDHRIVMSAAIASCFCENPVIIKSAQAVNKSYPRFFEDFKALGGNIK